MRCPFCREEMIKVLGQTQGNLVTGSPMYEELWHCPGCGFIAKFAHPVTGEREPFRLQAREKLKALGYL